MSRIAYICADPGVPAFGTKGASVHVQEMIRAWRARGHEVTLYCTRLGDHRPDDLSDLRTVHVRLERETRDAQREIAQEVAASELAQRAIADRPDAVYERYSLFSTALAEVATACAIPAFLEVNAPLIEEQKTHRVLYDEERAQRAVRTQLAAASVVTCVSPQVAQWVQTIDPQANTRVTPNGVNVDRIRPVTPDASRPTVVFVGTLKPWHGVEALLEAAALARRPWQLRIIGTGPQEDALRAQAAALGLDVDFRGAVAPEAMGEALQGAWIGVAPYPDKADHYFSPLKVYEYAAAALPVVATRVNGMDDIVADGETGRIVPPSDPAALAATIDDLVADPARAAAWGRAGRADVERHHTWHNVLDQTIGGCAL